MPNDINTFPLKNSTYKFNPLELGLNEKVRLVIHDNEKKNFSHIVELDQGEKIEMPYSDFAPTYNFKSKYQVLIDGKWVDKVKYAFIRDEIVDDNQLKYLYFPQQDSRYLIVVFQAINENPGYVYVKNLSNLHHNKIFIKDDYGEDSRTKSSYYLGKNKSSSISDSVIELIEKKRKELNIEKENVICCGSSKGGYAAIFHAFKGQYGYCISGGPQILLGNYLLFDPTNPRGFRAEIFKYLTGSMSKCDISWLNGLIFEQMLNPEKTKLFLHVGLNEPHYEEHAIPLLKSLEGRTSISLDLPDYSTHEELAKYFPVYLYETVKEITESN